jgi:hypothetical protein
MNTRVVDENLIRKAPRSTDDLLALLFDGLNWPLPAGMEVEDVPLLAWSPEELHLDPNAVARLTRIQQLPSLATDQPFGVFILSFDGGRLPVGAVRRVVNKLIRKKRAQPSTDHSLWDLHDLIFFCQSHRGIDTLHVVAFRETDNVPVMRVISWDTQATDNRIRLIASENLPDLAWPDLSHIDPDTWRSQWTSAFSSTYRQGVRTAAALAARMADVAEVVRDEVRELYEVETDKGPLRQLYAEVEESLWADLTPERFADMYAQTMVYGLLTARITHPEDFHADAVNSVLKFENPFLDALYASFRRKGDEAFDVDEFGLHDLAELLAHVDVDQLLADFGVEDRREDPVVFFYEDFLERYDPAQRLELGAFYTPIPAVRCIIRGVDHLIKTEFGLAEGVADRTNWGDYTKAVKIPIPAGMRPTDPVIRMIDPAAGTGTFLLEWLRQGMCNLDAEGTGTAHNRRSLLEQMDAFEIALSSYAVAHLKTSLELPPDLRAEEHIGIRLTDTLAGPRELTLLGDDPIAEEGQRAELIKFATHHNICVANPPYMRVDRQTAGGWIAHPPGGGRSLFDDIHEPARQHTIFSHQASLYNLYVYFWRWAIWKVFEQTDSGPGIVGFITASSWLRGPGFLGLRQLARQLADDIFVVDLGGDNLGARTSANIFPIQTPVAIVLLVRRRECVKDSPARVRYTAITGTRAEKLASLDQFDIETAPWVEVAGDWRSPFEPTSGGSTWQDFPALIDLFPWQQPGCMWNRTWPIAPQSAILEARWRRFVATKDPTDRATCFVTPPTGRNINTRVAGLPRLADLPIRAPHRPIARYGFRSFDRQWAFDDPRLAALERPALWASLGADQVFMASLITGRLSNGPAATVSTAVPDKHYFNGRGGKDVIPLYRDSDLTPNVDPALIDAVTAAHREVDSSAREVSAESLFAYVYGVLAGADYTTRFVDELATPGPRVPLSRSPYLFAAMAAHGESLLWLHTFGERFQAKGRRALNVERTIRWSHSPSRIPADLRDCRYDEGPQRLLVGDGVLMGVKPDVWSFEVSGMQVVKKWLGYRTARGAGRAVSSSSPLDQIRPNAWDPDWSLELSQLVHVLTQTLDLQQTGADLLGDILEGDLVSASELPKTPDALREPPAATRELGGLLSK